MRAEGRRKRGGGWYVASIDTVVTARVHEISQEVGFQLREVSVSAGLEGRCQAGLIGPSVQRVQVRGYDSCSRRRPVSSASKSEAMTAAPGGVMSSQARLWHTKMTYL